MTVTSHYAEVECRLFKDRSNQIAPAAIEEAAQSVLAPGERINDIVLCTMSNQNPHKVTIGFRWIDDQNTQFGCYEDFCQYSWSTSSSNE